MFKIPSYPATCRTPRRNATYATAMRMVCSNAADLQTLGAAVRYIAWYNGPAVASLPDHWQKILDQAQDARQTALDVAFRQGYRGRSAVKAGLAAYDEKFSALVEMGLDNV